MFEDDHQCGGREEERKIPSTDRGMKRSSQIFTVSVSIFTKRGLSLERVRALRKMNYRRET